MSRLAGVMVAVLVAASAAVADGAFPGSESLFLPADDASRYVLATNFGLVISSDGAQTWQLVCEMAELAPNAFIYQVGPGPDHRLMAVSLDGLSFSDDDGCTWALPDGGAKASDVFPDPSNGAHLLMVGRVLLGDGGALPDGVYESQNGGATFSATPLFSAPPGASMTGVEIAAAAVSTYYATYFIPPSGDAGFRPFVARSDDDGATWVATELTSQIGPAEVRLAAVDKVDPMTAYLRMIDAFGRESLAISTDGGALASVVLSLQAAFKMTAFLQRSDGSLIASQAQVSTPSGPGGSFLSTNGGVSFAPYLTNLHVYGLAERGGALYVAADNLNDGFAVGELLADGGVQPLLRYQGICGVMACGSVAAACNAWFCQGSGLTQPEQQVLQIPQTVCGAQPCGADGGTSGADGGTSKSSCGCAAPAGGGWALGLLALAALVLSLPTFSLHTRRSPWVNPGTTRQGGEES